VSQQAVLMCIKIVLQILLLIVIQRTFGHWSLG